MPRWYWGRVFSLRDKGLESRKNLKHNREQREISNTANKQEQTESATEERCLLGVREQYAAEGPGKLKSQF